MNAKHIFTRSILFLFMLGIAESTTIVDSAHAQSSTEQQARDFVANIAQDTIRIIQDHNLSDADKEIKLDNIFKQTVDIKWIGRFALGKYVRTITPEEQAKYDDLYAKFLVNSYVPNFRKYTKETLNITKAEKYADNQYMVYTLIERPGKQPLHVNYMIQPDVNNPGKFLIFDIIAEGVSLITTERSEFGSIISNNGINYLLDQLEKKSALEARSSQP